MIQLNQGTDAGEITEEPAAQECDATMLNPCKKLVTKTLPKRVAFYFFTNQTKNGSQLPQEANITYFSIIAHSVVRNSLAILAAFSSATLVTFTGSTIPVSKKFSYSIVWAFNH